MTSPVQVNGAAPLKNVVAFNMLLHKLVHRRPDLPGLGCFSGPSGYGKSRSAIFGANRFRAVYVECGQFTTARSLLISILKEFGVSQPRGSIAEMIETAIMVMAGDRTRPLIVDEAHWIAHKRFVDVLRELHDKSQAPVVMIGEEMLPKSLEAFERVHNRILDGVVATACDAEDFALLVKAYCDKVQVAPDLASMLLQSTKGNTRRIVVNLARVSEIAKHQNAQTVDLTTFGGQAGLIGWAAPLPRRVA